MEFRVLLNHNQLARWLGYAAGDKLANALQVGNVPDKFLEKPDLLLTAIFKELNSDSPKSDWARTYSLAGHRSLQVGDIVRLAGEHWAVCKDGFSKVTVVTDQIINENPPDITIPSHEGGPLDD